MKLTHFSLNLSSIDTVGGGGGYGYGQQNQSGYGYQQQQQPQADYSQGYDQYNSSGYGRSMGYQAQGQAYSQPQGVQYQASQSYGVSNQSAPVSQWKSATSPDGQIYYYNERTGETQWDKPMGMP